jgi:hypothetical protein
MPVATSDTIPAPATADMKSHRLQGNAEALAFISHEPEAFRPCGTLPHIAQTFLI